MRPVLGISPFSAQASENFMNFHSEEVKIICLLLRITQLPNLQNKRGKLARCCTHLHACKRDRVSLKVLGDGHAGHGPLS